MKYFSLVFVLAVLLSGCGGRVVFLKDGYLLQLVQKNHIKSERAGFLLDGIYLEGTVITTESAQDFVTLVQNNDLLRIPITEENKKYLIYHEEKQ